MTGAWGPEVAPGGEVLQSQNWHWTPRPASPGFGHQMALLLRGGAGKGAPGVRGCGRARNVTIIPQFASLAASAGLRPQRLPGGPGHQTDAGNRSSQEPHLLLTWAGAAPIGLPTLLPEQPPAIAVGVPVPAWPAWTPPRLCMWGVPGLARPKRRPCPAALWRPAHQVGGRGRWEPSGGTGPAAACPRWEVI